MRFPSLLSYALVFVILSCTLTYPVVQAVNEAYFNEIANCLQGRDDEAAALACVLEYSKCLSSAGVAEVKSCFVDDSQLSVKSEVSTIEDCLNDHIECIEGEVQAITSSLPVCMNTTLVALGQCFVENAQTCSATCDTDDVPEENPFEGLDPSFLSRCAPFQQDIVNPTCEIVDCCEACIPPFEEFMNCIAQDALDLKQLPPNSQEPCTVSCPASRRKLSRRDLGATGKQMTDEPEDILMECSIYLATEEGLVGGKAGVDGLQKRLAEGDFVVCVIENLFDLIETTNKKDEEEGTSGGSINTSMGGNTNTITICLAALLGLLV